MMARHKDTGEIIQLSEEGIESSDGRKFCWYQVELIPEPCDKWKPSLPSNLDEAANNYCIDIRLGYPRVMDETDRYIYNAFKAGAEWMAGQGVTVDGKVIMDFSEPTDIINRRLIAKLGDALLKVEPGEVIVQIRKK